MLIVHLCKTIFVHTLASSNGFVLFPFLNVFQPPRCECWYIVVKDDPWPIGGCLFISRPCPISVPAMLFNKHNDRKTISAMNRLCHLRNANLAVPNKQLIHGHLWTLTPFGSAQSDHRVLGNG